jgi:cyclic beta-1,2-glucan synthetase
LGGVQVQTPDPALDLMVNRRLLYQAIASRLWGRTGMYQSSGAFGFRDQLQDSLGLLGTAPELCRAHVLEAARHQFVEGDVLHWWHPPSGDGLRSRCSDDLLWLPYVVTHYVEATGDAAILEALVPLIDGPTLAEDAQEQYQRAPPVESEASLYEHCMRALRRAMTRGPHGLPLIGSGDWNDGFSRIGIAGRGESVWLGWFVHACCTRFASLARATGHGEDADWLEQRTRSLLGPLEGAWDGDWYVRAFHDDGTRIGSKASEECRIDAIAQSWAVICGAARTDRQRTAMDSVWTHLVRTEDRLVLLFDPPFSRSRIDPGYVERYPPGIRENGGQYTHAAVWTGWAFTELGDADRAHRVFSMIGPIAHASTREAAERYRVEPYVIAADIYSQPPHTGRGGWTWYTGAAAWAYRLATERILGVRREQGRFVLAPCIPPEWPGFSLTLRQGTTTWHVRVENGGTGRVVDSFSVDGRTRPLPVALPAPDGRSHQVVVRLR